MLYNKQKARVTTVNSIQSLRF